MQTKGIYTLKRVQSRGKEKVFISRIGAAHFQDDGSIDLNFDSFPVRTDGSISIKITDKKEHENHERTTD